MRGSEAVFGQREKYPLGKGVFPVVLKTSLNRSLTYLFFLHPSLMKAFPLLFFILLAALSCKKSDPQSDQKILLSFSFTKAANPALSADAAGMISGQQVTLMLPAGTKAEALKATFSTSPLASVSTGGAKQESGVTSNDFTKSVTYRVTAEDGSTADYTVNVVVAKSGEKSLAAFSFLKTANPDLPADLPLTLSGTQLAATLPAGVKPTALKASFTAPPAATVTVAGVKQESGVTANDFTNPLTYRVTAEDGSTADYVVTITVTKSTARELLSLTFLKTANPSLSDDVTVSLNASKNSYLVTLPTGAAPAALKATFTTSPGATITVNGAAQTSGITAPDFSKAITYRVTAENGEFKEYAVETSVQVDLPTIENAVKAFMNKYNLPGLSIAITKDERLVYAKGYGMADQEKGVPVTNSSIFRLGSLSKPITGIAAMKLVDEGKLDLDQKVFGAGGILGTTYGTQPYSANLEKITVRQLLNHTAGGDAWTSGWDPANNRIDPFYQKEWLAYTQAQVLSATIDNRPVTQTPGTKMVYSNVGIGFVGRVIEKLSGLSYEKYVQEHVLNPLGIPAASMRIAKGSQDGRVSNEVTYYNPYTGYDQPYAFPIERMDAQGAWAATSVHLMRLLAYTDGFSGKKDILTSKSVQEMLTPSAASVAQNSNWGYSLGWYVSPLTGTSTHDGGLAGTSTTWWRLSTGYSFVVLVNTRKNEPSYYPDLETFLNTALFSGNPLTATQLMKGDQFEVFYK